MEVTLSSPALHTANANFEDLYLALRAYEKRVYTDMQVSGLPDIDPSHQYFKEWEVRKASAQRLIAYLESKLRSLNVLEVGCGNGWLSAKIAGIPSVKVTGVDINQVDIHQAKRVFKKNNLQFICNTLDGDKINDMKFDTIIFAAVLSYFPSIKNVLQLALDKLEKGGELHLVDTNFYKQGEVAGAIKRCRNYYDEMGFPEMAEQYYHHTLNDLQGFKYKIMFDPTSILNRLGKKKPFYWISITN